MLGFSEFLGVLLNCLIFVQSKSYYTIIAPGVIKSNHNYTVSVSLHEANEPATINVRIEGPFYFTSQNLYLQPYQTKSIIFEMPKLADGDHKLLAEGISGIEFRNESLIEALYTAGPKIYIQTDKAVYKPGDEVQFRVVILDEHTRPLIINEPIRVEILDADDNRVKQFKDISLIHGIYKNKFQLSEYPALGGWEIKVTISGKYDETSSKIIFVKKYVLPKFNVYLKVDNNLILADGDIKAMVYAKYTFDQYVEGNTTIRLKDRVQENVLSQKMMNINTTGIIEFSFNRRDRKILESYIYGLELEVEFTEKHTGLTHSTRKHIRIREQRYHIGVYSESIQYREYKPYRLKAYVEHWNGAPVLDRQTPIVMQHGRKEYEAYLDINGEAVFEFEHDSDANHVFRYKDSTYTFPNIYAEENITGNQTLSYCKLTLKGGKSRLGTTLEFEVTSVEFIPYINYIIVGHANIIKTEHLVVPPRSKSFTIEITPSIEMIPISYIYVHYIQNGHLRYDELKLTFPLEFENKISVLAPKEVEPGHNVTIELKAQPKSYVGLLAVDLGVYILDSSYDLKRDEILKDLEVDQSYSPIAALVYPGLLSGVLTLTNAHYRFESGPPRHTGKVGGAKNWNFRKKFPETWIFQNYDISTETTQLSLTIPDSITTWRITAFTVNAVTGFGIVDGPTDIIVRQTFFISLNLPYSVKRGEIVQIPVIVFNYHNQSLNTKISIDNENQEFYVVESSHTSATKVSDAVRKLVKQVIVPANGAEKVSFLITPRQVGDISLRITAENAITSDAIMQTLKVEPEGVPQRHNKVFNVFVTAGETYSTSYKPDIPKNIVPDSEYLTLSVSGDSMVPTLTNLNDLVQLPTGCGEQNMVNFAPNVLVLQYLKAAGKYYKERSLVAKAKEFLEIGYQQELTFRHRNGGFSVFGKKDDEPSTWLTAYVIRFFIKASKYLPIEASIIESGMEFLTGTQYPAGDFPYTGYLFYPAQQNRYGFTAFVLMTFLEDKKYANKYQSTIQKGLAFLNANLNRINDIYALSIVATTLKMAKHENAERAIEKLKLSRHQLSDSTWWSQNDKNPEKDIEITAYVLMALLDNDNDSGEDQKILKWLLDQRNEKGGFKSTHDTVVGLQALVKFSEKYGNIKKMNLKIEYTAKANEHRILECNELKVDDSNALLLQAQVLPRSTRMVDLKVTGSGNSLIQISYHYHTITDNQIKYFHIQPQPSMLNPSEMLLNICFHFYQPIVSTDGKSDVNMILLEVNLPSGFTTNEAFMNDLLDNELIQRVELKNSETTLIVYLEKISANVENCLDILADKVNDVLKRKPAAIIVYDYYNISRYDTVFYEI